MRSARCPGAVAVAALVVVVGFAAPRSVADDPPAKGGPDEKAEVLTEAKLVGEWKGKTANGSIEIDFSAKKKGENDSVALFDLNAGGLVTFAAVAYKIDAEKNEVRFPGHKTGVARLTKDGALEFSGTFTFGTNTYTVPKTLLVRSKADAPKK